jgi:hypothetical protein
MDAAPSRPAPPAVPQAPREIHTGLVGEFALKNWFNSDGSRRSSRRVRDRARQHVDAFTPLKDAATLAVDAAMADWGNPHKPGWRTAAADGTTNDAVNAYNLYVSELNDAWKTPERKAQDLLHSQRVDPPKPADWDAPGGVQALE